MDLFIGSHVSYKKDKQLLGCVEETLKYKGNAFMFYTGAPQNTKRTEINDEKTLEAYKLMKENNILLENVIVHAPYIVNLATNDKEKYNFAINFLREEINRCEQLGIKYMVLHPGSHVGVGALIGIQNITHALDICLDNNPSVMILLETMAGKGTEVGRDFFEINEIITNCKYKDNLGVCLDTCHIHDAGYDLEKIDSVLDEFDNIIGLKKLKCVHINDSVNIKGAKKDRHANIGYGQIGFDNLLKIIYHEKLDGIPKIIETPYIAIDDNSKEKIYPPYKEEIKMIRNKQFNDTLMEDIRQGG